VAGRHLHLDRHRQGQLGNNVAISTEVQGIVDSVDLTASPPLLSIGGQNYTTDKIKRVVRQTPS
jgi:flagellar basal-body rod modification protein FlgD